MIKVFIGDNTKYLSDIATKIDPAAYLCTDKNYNTSINGTVYTSLADLSIKNFCELITMSDRAIYCPPTTWSSSVLKEQTHLYLNFLNNKKEIKGFKNKVLYQPEYLSIVDTRKTNQKQIWIVGCSLAQGYAVADTEGYGYLIGKELDLPVSFLTEASGSISWAADQILRADIREDDIVIWGLTAVGRMPFVDESDNLQHSMPYSVDKNKDFKHLFNKNFLVSNHVCYEAISHIEQATEYMNKNNIKYILGVFPLSINKHKDKLLKYVSQFRNSLLLYDDTKEKLPVTKKFIDLANDNTHPGIMQHRWYADSILEFYKNNKLTK